MIKSPYLRLMRLHQPAGIPLLMWPCWWAIALASNGFPPVSILFLFAVGAVLMRGAGCIVNDIADRKFDPHVERTKTRPLASGELSLKQAILFLGVLLSISLVIAIILGKMVLIWAVLSLIPVTIYPFMKRISWWPQLYLGLTFNWGALMGWVAIAGQIELPAVMLYIGGIFWTLGYDTIYAHQDKEDDLKIGVKSTALRLSEKTRPFVALFYSLAVICWFWAGFFANVSVYYNLLVMLCWLHFLWQTNTTNLDDPTSCRKAFISNAYQLGPLMFAACLLG